MTTVSAVQLEVEACRRALAGGAIKEYATARGTYRLYAFQLARGAAEVTGLMLCPVGKKHPTTKTVVCLPQPTAEEWSGVLASLGVAPRGQ